MKYRTTRDSIWSFGIEQPRDKRRWPAVIQVAAGELVESIAPADVGDELLRSRLIKELNLRVDDAEPAGLLIRMRDWFCVFAHEDLEHVSQLYPFRPDRDPAPEDASTVTRPAGSVQRQPAARYSGSGRRR